MPLSQIKDSSYEIISNLKVLSEELKNSDYNLIIKPHPNIEISKILSFFWSNELPKNITISNDSIDKLLDDCLFVITMSTGGAYNAAINGNIIFNLKSELNFTDNYLDFVKKRFKLASSYSIMSIKEVLIELQNKKGRIIEYSEEFKKLKDYFISGMNTVDKTNLAKFKFN